jgi:hypothetical protein
MLARRSRRSVAVIIGSLLAVAALTAGIATLGPWAHSSPGALGGNTLGTNDGTGHGEWTPGIP